ncbi:hypothetical protein [Teichococcus aestuarii]|uniref:Tc1-like transposase DDE domain-containing protein n=1 Tax=Teichococcus aestuarii TaxID=568898 RepID=A0A2U1UXH4_9PROT|nr:hypothetical protein [Pseudoroseomonas aestuarii]PWC26322.1 hypothetical protein CR165_23830 [Pseudoroseomonas aestuarii]
MILPFYDVAAVELHLTGIFQTAAPGAHAVPAVDQADSHTVPANIALLPLPPCSPAPDPVENVWQLMRDSWPANQVFKSGANIVDDGGFA